MESTSTISKAMTLHDCKDQVAKKNGFFNWSDLQDKMAERYNARPIVHEVHLEQVAILYASSQNEALREGNKELIQAYESTQKATGLQELNSAVNNLTAIISKAKELNGN